MSHSTRARGIQPAMRNFPLALLLLASPAAALPVEGRVMTGHDGAWRVAVLLDGDAPPAPPTVGRLDEVWLTFVPKVQVLPVGSLLQLVNHDDHAHTVHGRIGRSTLFHYATAPDGLPQQLRVNRPGIVRITCEMHAEMRGTVVVARTPYQAVTDEEGRFAIADVPPGHYRVRAVWGRGDDDPPDPGDDDPGAILAEVDLDESSPPIALRLPPAVPRDATEVLEPTPPPYHRPPPFDPPNWLLSDRSAHPWPTGIWVYLLSGLAIAAGLIASALLAFRGGRAGWSKLSIIAIGCLLSLLAGAFYLLGLHVAVAAALGFGLFIGTAIFAADQEEPAA